MTTDEQDAFAAAYARLAPGLRQTIQRRYLRGHQADAEDIVQAVFCETWASPERRAAFLASTPAQQARYVQMTARCRATDELRRRQYAAWPVASLDDALGSLGQWARESVPDPDLQGQPEDAALTAEMVAALAARVWPACHTAKERRVFALEIQGYTGDEIAARVPGTTRGSIKASVFRVRDRLRARAAVERTEKQAVALTA